MARLEVDIYKKTGDFELNVSFVAENEIMAILGASGCGKSMTLKCIAGIISPDKGRIILNGETLFDSEKHINVIPQKRNVGYMFQDYALFPNMNVEENIGIAIKEKDKALKAKKIDDLVDRFHLAGLERHLPSGLSGGQKQRVAMARMMASEPEIILLDEPFSALDSFLKWELEQEMSETLERLNKTTLFVSHNRDEVYRICDRVACISSGQLEEPRTVKEFFSNPKSRTAAMLSGCKNIAAVEHTGENTIFLSQWNLILSFTEKISEDISFAGIRAHSLNPVFSKDEISDGKNYIRISSYKLIEDPFEWNLSFKNEGAAGSMQWKISKNDWDARSFPVAFFIKEEDVLLLTD